ncbi:MAG: ABC transporter ATP-binding protein [bacterium]
MIEKGATPPRRPEGFAPEVPGASFLEVDGLSGGYGEGLIFQGVHFSLPRGQFAALVGPNGSGKTTLLRGILGLLPQQSGSVRLDGREVHEYGRRELAKRVSLLIQEDSESFPFSVEEIVMMGRFPHNPFFPDTPQDRQAVQDSLERVGLARKAKKPYLQLSGGEKRRAMIARSLAQEAQLLLLDEPTLHLDLRYQLETTALLRQLAESGLAVLAVYHDFRLASMYAQRVLLFQEGRLVSDCPPGEVDPQQALDLYGLDAKFAPAFRAFQNLPS